MNCECFYVVPSMTKAQEVVERIKKMDAELYPVTISKTTKEFKATQDYDNQEKPFTVEKNSLLVFAQGKYHCMSDIKDLKIKCGFFVNPDDFDYIVDLEEIE